ncbi:MAG: DNA polymerase I [Candidatus Nomurabacteria bacterium]|jgi:DNA polymerase-1|nr:DNA polymerase I [Candidatus Nomurabacteria bacterium]
MTKKLAIIDGMSVFYRGYYAMSNLTMADGTPVGGVYGFTAMALELVRKYQPDYVAVAWDKPGTNSRRRRAIYPEYKAGRKPAPPDFYAQVPILRELLQALGWPLYECDDFEADDIIGALAEQADKQGGIDTLMITSDLDMLQIVDHNTRLYALKRGFTDIEEFDIAALEAKFGIKKEQFLDLKALKGDSSDNIPGVPGVGEKTGVALLQEFGDLDTIYANLDKIKPAWRSKLEAGKDLAYVSKRLGEIQFDAPVKLDLKAMDVKNLDVDKLRAELEKLEFKSLLRRLPDYMKSDKPVAETGPVDVPGIFYVLDDGRVVANDGKVLCEQLLAEGKPLPEIEFDTRIASFLLGRILGAGSAADLQKLYKVLAEKLRGIPKLDRLARDLDFPMQALLARIEARGVRIDVAGLAEMSADLSRRLDKIENEIHELADSDFNIASPAQLSQILFEKLLLPTTGIKRNKNGFSTGREELDKLKGQHPIIAKIIDHREVAKLKNTYVDALPKLVDDDSYLHTSFHQDVTATGRLSSSEPNLQNIPIRTELGQKIRKYFVASPGKVLVSADYSQFELRLAAALGGDKQLIADFEDDAVDIHTKTAADVYGVAAAEVSQEQRRNAKVINFGVLYGMSPHRLALNTGMSFSEAKMFIEKYFEIRRPVREFLDRTIKMAEDEGYVETYFGRRRATPDVRAGNFMIREAAKRAAANMPIQGTEADLMKMAMLKIEAELGDIAPQILQIHDSIMVECDPKNAKKVGQKMREIMEGIYPKIGVRLKVDIKTGENWGEL